MWSLPSNSICLPLPSMERGDLVGGMNREEGEMEWFVVVEGWHRSRSLNLDSLEKRVGKLCVL